MSLTTPLAASAVAAPASSTSAAASPSEPAPASGSHETLSAPQDRAGFAVTTVLGDAALALGLLAVGFALRLPYLWTIPRFTDETREGLRAVELLNGSLSRPEILVNVDAYIGGLYIWLLAAVYWLTGVSAYTPRLVMAVAGGVAVAFTYLLARDLGGRLSGLIAAALLATSGGQILSNGHIGWSHCLTPALTTMAAWLLQRAVRMECKGSWLVSGLVWGLALQSHPATGLLLPGAAIYVLWWGRKWLRTPWPYAALVLFVVAFSNMIAYNLMTDGGTFREAAAVRDRYDAGIVVNFLVYLGNHGLPALMLLRYLAGAVDARGSATAYLLDPTLWLYAGLSVAGLIYAARRGAPLLLLMTISSVLIMPYYNQRKYVPITDGRYLMPLLPFLYAATGMLLAAGWQRIGVWQKDRMNQDRVKAVRIAFVVAVALLVLYPLVPLDRYFQQEIAAGRTNTPLLQAVDSVSAARRPDEAVLLDRDLADIKLEGGGTAFRSLRFLLTGVGIDDRSIDSVSDYARKMTPGSSALLVTDARGFERLKPELAGLVAAGVQSTAVIAPPGRDGYGAYRLERTAPVGGLSLPPSVAFGRGGFSTYAASPPSRASDGSDSRQSGGKPAAIVEPEVPVERFATSLVNPRGLAFRSDGNLFVALAGNGGPDTVEVGREKPHHYGKTGQVLRIDPAGGKFSMAKNLPSIVTAVNEECGPSAIAFIGDRTFILSASGGWDFGDPAYHSGIYELKSDGSMTQIWDMTAHVLANPAKARREDPRADVPAGMAYGMTALDGKLYVTDANQEQLFEVDPNTGAARQVVEYPKSNRAMTGVTAGPDGAIYVAEWASNKITRITLDGKIEDAATKLRFPVGVTFGSDGAMYVVEFTGRVLRAAPVGQEQKDILVDGLRAPTAITFGPDGNLYVSVHGQGAANGEGEILRLRLAPPSPESETAKTMRGLTWASGLVVFAALMGLGWWFRQRSSVKTNGSAS